MKELSIEEKAKAYDVALENAKHYHSEMGDDICCVLEECFPVLKESEDERMKNFISNELACIRATDEKGSDRYNKLTEALAWLEKQKERGPLSKDEEYTLARIIEYLEDNDCPSKWKDLLHDVYALPYQKEQREDITRDKIAEYLKKLILDQSQRGTHMLDYEGRIEEEVDFIISIAKKELKKVEQKSTDKVESKFKVNEWVVTGINDVVQIKAVNNGHYTIDNGMEFNMPYVDRYWHKWTIQDAKDGDVLVLNDEVFIYAHRKQLYDIAVAHCFVNSGGGFYFDGEFGYIERGNSIHPATKEQRNLLFQKMEEAGYMWDAEKKEPKKIKQKSTDKAEPKFRIGDWVVIAAFENEDYHPVGKVIDIKFHCDKTGKVTVSYIIKGLDGKLIDDGIDSNISENQLRYWTISDAKDGDVLATWAGAFIYNGNNGGGGCPGSYCGINTLGNFKVGVEHHWTGKNVFPATKEQRDLLFRKMKEAGYEWDANKKELKKIEQKFTDKVESKFKVGNWYQCTKEFFGKGVTFDKNTAYYCAREGCLQNEYGCHIAIVKDLYDNFKLWTIQDARVGDVLASKDKSNILIFRNLDTSTSFSSYYNTAGKGELGWSNECFIPATKEQRDLLFTKMKEAGYEWNDEKKELKKIEQKSAWSEEDEDAIGMAIIALEDMYDEDAPNTTYGGYNLPFNKAAERLKSLKERYAWKKSLATADLENSLCDIQDGYSDTSYEYRILGEAIEFIRCTEPQPHWKPSKEQITELHRVISGCSYDIEPLVEIEKHLKKLMEE